MVHKDSTGKSFCWILILILAKVASQHTGKSLNMRLSRKCGMDRMFCQALSRVSPGRNERRTNNANVVVPPTVSAVSKKEPQENIARIAKRYLDDNMQQAWINPRLISMVSEYKCNDYTSEPRTYTHLCSLYFLVRVRSYNTYTWEVRARVLSEPANKLVCGGLPHCESFVINLLGGNARTLHPR
ncbi:hypothetical protein ALC62_12456 [Cyphomyrmex costatus]|uniref:Uncharacterized protein n=1 Tax=Cyphomyrmex costatus TaxID=456900 RepID=A0A151IB41_9HYME|nr:hypothetical protein ALC62_12456 [Cyphomyrmex costatus]